MTRSSFARGGVLEATRDAFDVRTRCGSQSRAPTLVRKSHHCTCCRKHAS
jgi:hypothetical protein